MNTRQKALRTGAIFIAVLIVAGLLLLYKGNDAVAIGMGSAWRRKRAS